MNAPRLEKWLQIGANVGILGGLILVWFQMEQNTNILRTQIMYQESERYLQFENAMLGENPSVVWAKTLEAPEELTLEEQRVADAIFYTGVETWRAMYNLSQQGLLDEEWRARADGEASYLLSNEYGKAWWENYKNYVDDEFALVVDESINRRPNQTLNYHNNIMRILNEK